MLEIYIQGKNQRMIKLVQINNKHKLETRVDPQKYNIHNKFNISQVYQNSAEATNKQPNHFKTVTIESKKNI